MKKFWQRFGGVISSLLVGTTILLFGIIKNEPSGYIFGGIFIAWAIISLFNGDTKKF